MATTTESCTFNVEINRGLTQAITVKTGVYRLAALAALALVEHEPRDDFDIVKIWAPHLPSHGPYFFTWDSEAGAVSQLTGADPRKW